MEPTVPAEPADRGFGVLHLVDRDCSPTVCALLTLLGERLGRSQFPQRILALGEGPHVGWLARYGLSFERVPLRGQAEPARSLMLGRRLSGGWDAAGSRPIRLIHAHSPRAALMAAAASVPRPALHRVPLAVEVYRTPRPRRLGWLAYLARRRPGWQVNLIARSQQLRREVVAAGFDVNQVGALRPPLQIGRISRADRDAVRAELGIDGGSAALLAGGWGRRDDNQRLVLWAGAILNLLDDSLRVIVPGDGGQQDRLARWIGEAGFGAMARFSGDRFDWPELVAACDVLVHASADEVETTHVGWAMSAGAPVVAVATAGLCELIEDSHNGLLCRADWPRGLAMQIRRMLIDDALRAKLTDQARHEAFHYFNPSDAVGLYKEFYQHFRLEQLGLTVVK